MERLFSWDASGRRYEDSGPAGAGPYSQTLRRHGLHFQMSRRHLTGNIKDVSTRELVFRGGRVYVRGQAGSR